jgi:hypothetical protein
MSGNYSLCPSSIYTLKISVDHKYLPTNLFIIMILYSGYEYSDIIVIEMKDCYDIL